MKPESISERMMYNTVRIRTGNGSCGTGSFFTFKIEEISVPIIITNKHVVNYNMNEPTTFNLHTCGEDGNPNGNLEITYNTNWVFHESKDLCYCYMSPLLTEIEKRFKKRVYYITNDESILPDESALKDLSALEELVMVGYPIGLWDMKNNFPIFRKGFTACHPAIDFNENEIGLVDMACFPGSSGSPIYVLNEGSYRDKKGNSYFGRSRILLLGYLFAGPQYTANGNIVIETIPTQQKASTETPMMVNLGYYVKSSVLKDFRLKILEDISKQD